MDPTVGVTLSIKSRLTESALNAYIAEHAIQRSQIITITEPIRDRFTLIYEPTAEQLAQHTSETAEKNDTLTKLFNSGPLPIRRG